MKKLRIHKGKLNIIEMTYVLLPLVLFVFGWTRWYIAGVCFLVAFFCYRGLFKTFMQQEDAIDISTPLLIAGVLFLLLVGYSCGWGRWVRQPAIDYEKHNAILADLTNQSWPVYYNNGDEHAMLTYYIGQYLVPAFVGKLFCSFRMAEIVTFVWSSLGVILVWIHLLCSLRITKPKRQIASAVFLTLFSQPLFLAELIGDLLGVPIHSSLANTDWFSIVSEAGIHIQYSSNYVLLNWVFPQTIVCWITTLLLIDYKEEIRYYIPLALPSMLFSALSFVGLVMVASAYAVVDLMRDYKIKAWVKKIISTENILFMATVGSVLLLYFAGNVLSAKPKEMQFYFSPVAKEPLLFLVFYVFCVMPYPFCLARWCKKEALFWIATAILFLLPLLHLGMVNDLMMRASIPALFIIMYEILRVYNEHEGQSVEKIIKRIKSSGKNILIAGILALFLLYGAIYPISNVVSNMKTSKGLETTELYTWGTTGIYADRNLETEKIARIREKVYNYFTYDVEETVFYRFFARKNITEDDIVDEKYKSSIR